jgi:hypothetical protein
MSVDAREVAHQRREMMNKVTSKDGTIIAFDLRPPPIQRPLPRVGLTPADQRDPRRIVAMSGRLEWAST